MRRGDMQWVGEGNVDEGDANTPHVDVKIKRYAT